MLWRSRNTPYMTLTHWINNLFRCFVFGFISYFSFWNMFFCFRYLSYSILIFFQSNFKELRIICDWINRKIDRLFVQSFKRACWNNINPNKSCLKLYFRRGIISSKNKWAFICSAQLWQRALKNGLLFVQSQIESTLTK
jgi:hypothetical protein